MIIKYCNQLATKIHSVCCFDREMSDVIAGSENKGKNWKHITYGKKFFHFYFPDCHPYIWIVPGWRVSKSWKTTSLSTPSCQLSFAQLSPFLSCRISRYETSEYTCIIHTEPRITMPVRFRPYNKNRIMQDSLGLYPKNII